MGVLTAVGPVWTAAVSGFQLRDSVILSAGTALLVCAADAPPAGSSVLRFLVLDTTTGQVVHQFDWTLPAITFLGGQYAASFYRLDDATAAICQQLTGGVAAVGTVSIDGAITAATVPSYPVGSMVHDKSAGAWAWFDPDARTFTRMYWTEYSHTVTTHAAPYYTAYGYTVDLSGAILESWPVTVGQGVPVGADIAFPQYYGTLMLPHALHGGAISAVIDAGSSFFTLTDNTGAALWRSPSYPGSNYGANALIYQVDSGQAIAIIWSAWVPPGYDSRLFAQYFTLNPFAPLGSTVDLGRNNDYSGTLDEALAGWPVDVSREFTTAARVLAASFRGYGGRNDPAGPASSVIGAIQNVPNGVRGQVERVNVELGVGSYRFQRITPAVASLGDLVLFAGRAQEDYPGTAVHNYAQLYRIGYGIPPLRQLQRDDGLGAAGHSRLNVASTLPNQTSSVNAARAPRLGERNNYV